MPTLRGAATVVTDLACQTMGQRHVIRAARFVFRRACLDVPNDMRSNGESWLQQHIIEFSAHGRKIHVIDVGANVGRWSAAMLRAAALAGRLNDLDLHAFEPSAYTFARLSESLYGSSVTLCQAALGERIESSILHVNALGAGTNSFHGGAEPSTHLTTEQVPTTTLDAYAIHAELDRIDLVKIDTEGHDLAVIRGARGLLAGQRIAIVQFEYNHRWVYARSFLRDAFELFEPFGYRLGKLTPLGVEFYPRWHADLESFVEGNYVACSVQGAEKLPEVAWWKPVT